MTVWYLDSSAIVKFAVLEVESAAMADWRAGLDADDVLSRVSWLLGIPVEAPGA